MSELILPWQVAEAMREGACPTDETFDRWLPNDLKIASTTFWTPIEVATRVAGWLDDLGIDTVMDIGSGAGSSASRRRSSARAASSGSSSALAS